MLLRAGLHKVKRMCHFYQKVALLSKNRDVGGVTRLIFQKVFAWLQVKGAVAGHRAAGESFVFGLLQRMAETKGSRHPHAARPAGAGRVQAPAPLSQGSVASSDPGLLRVLMEATQTMMGLGKWGGRSRPHPQH